MLDPCYPVYLDLSSLGLAKLHPNLYNYGPITIVIINVRMDKVKQSTIVATSDHDTSKNVQPLVKAFKKFYQG